MTAPGPWNRMWQVLLVAIPATAAVLLVNRFEPADRPVNVIAEMISEWCGPDGSFLAENRSAMHRMMKAMHVEPSGDIDRDFAAMMIPHHQGAIEMAQSELRHGHNEQLRRIAQGIIVEQQQEILAMHLAVGQGFGGPTAVDGSNSTLASAIVVQGEK